MIGYLIPAGLVIFWAGFALGRVGAAPRGRRAVPRHALQDPPAAQQDTPPAAQAPTEAHSAAAPVSSDTLDRWAEQYHAAPIELIDCTFEPRPGSGFYVTAAARPPGPPPRNVVWQPADMAAAAVAQLPPAHVGGQAAAVAGWYWHEYLRREHELWGPAGIDGPWAPGSMAADVGAVLDQMSAVAAAAAPALAAIAAAGMAAL